jgi:hypothetical protein
MQVIIDGRIQEAPTVREYAKKRGVPIQNAYLRIRRGVTDIEEIFATDKQKATGLVGQKSTLLKDVPGYENASVTQIAKDIGENRTTVHMWLKKGTFKEKVDRAYAKIREQESHIQQESEDQKILEAILRNSN